MSNDTITLPKVGTYTVDPAHTEVGFVARHLVGTKVRGRFAEFSGTFTVAENPEESTLEAEVKTASIHTNQSMRDDHLRTNDFLDAENLPHLTLKSTGLKKVTDTEWKLSTDLTIRGVTKPVEFDLEYLGRGRRHAGGQVRGRLLGHGRDRPPRLRRDVQPLPARRQRRRRQQGQDRAGSRSRPGRAVQPTRPARVGRGEGGTLRRDADRLSAHPATRATATPLRDLPEAGPDAPSSWPSTSEPVGPRRR